MNSTYDPITREHLLTVHVREIKLHGSTAYGSGSDADGQPVSFVVDRALAADLTARLQRGEIVETTIPTWAIFDGAPAPTDPAADPTPGQGIVEPPTLTGTPLVQDRRAHR